MSETAELLEVDPKYPVGKFQRPESVTAHDRMKAIAAIAALPAMLSTAVKGLDRDQRGHALSRRRLNDTATGTSARGTCCT